MSLVQLSNLSFWEATQEMGQSTFTFYKNEQTLVEWDAHPREKVEKLV